MLAEVPPRIWILWTLFLARGFFYCAAMPLWEGWDEYAHFAVLEHWIDCGTFPEARDPLSREVGESLRLAPLTNELAWIGPPSLTREQWWALPAAQRDDRARRLAALPPAWAHQTAEGSLRDYEAQQPPLYYWLLSLPLRWAGSWPLLSRVLLLRLLSLLIASCAIPLGWLAARPLLNDAGATLCAALFAVAPGFMIDSARIANDGLAIAAATLLFALLVRTRTHWAFVGATLGAALLTKGYCLALIPAVVFAEFRNKRRMAGGLALAASIAGWWYIRNLAAGRSITGWQDSEGASHLARGLLQIDWLRAAHVLAKSFIWFGGWSFLTLKSWMYALVEALALAGFVVAARRDTRRLAIPLATCLGFAGAIAYGELVIYAAHGSAALPGWYAWPIAGSLAVVVTAGLGRYAIALIGALACIDLYGMMALMAPYYAGLVDRNRANGALFFPALERLHVPVPLALLWIAATIAIPVIAIWPADAKNRQPGP